MMNEMIPNMPHIASHVFGVPLMIEPNKLEAILSFLGPRVLGEELSSRSPRSASEAKGMQVLDGIAILPIHGTLVQRGAWLGKSSGMTSYQGLREQFETAMEDPKVDAVLLDIDSGGGEVAGNFDLAEDIYSARGTKPIWALANEFAASAAYSLGAAAEKFYLTRTASVGSVGVISVHVDQSAKDEKSGLKYTNITAGAKKAEFDPHSPLSDDALVAGQGRVDDIYRIFVGNVARHRGLTEAAIRGTEAGIFMGQQAVQLGLADGVSRFEKVFSMLQEHIASGATISSPTISSSTKENVMTKTNTPDEEVESTPVVDTKAVDTEAVAAAATTAERERVSAITEKATKLGVSMEKAQKLINDGLSVEKAYGKLIDFKSEQADTNNIVSANTGSEDHAEIDPDLPEEERYTAEWNASAKVRKEFAPAGGEAAYKAYRKAEEKGLIRIYGQHS